MKKINFSRLAARTLSLLYFGLPLVTFAQNTLDTGPARQTAPAPITSLGDANGLTAIICTAINWIFTFLIIIAVIFVLIAAYKYLTAAGDPEKIKSANHQLIYAAVAVAVGIVANGVPLIVASFFSNVRFTGCQ